MNKPGDKHRSLHFILSELSWSLCLEDRILALSLINCEAESKLQDQFDLRFFVYRIPTNYSSRHILVGPYGD